MPWGLCERGAWGWEVVACRHRANGCSSSKGFWPHAALILAPLPMGRTGVCQHLFGSLWCPVPNWGRGEPASFPCSCGCSLLQRGRAEELEAMTFQALQMFAQWMWVSLSFPSSLLSQWLFSNLSILSFLQMRSKSGALCSSCQVSLRWNKKEIVASLPPNVILLRIKPILAFCRLSE